MKRLLLAFVAACGSGAREQTPTRIVIGEAAPDAAPAPQPPRGWEGTPYAPAQEPEPAPPPSTMDDALLRPATMNTSSQAYFEDAERAYALGDFALAVEDLEKAYELDPHHEYLFDLAQAYRFLGNAKNARFFYKRYLVLAERSGTDAPNRTEVEQYIAELDAVLY